MGGGSGCGGGSGWGSRSEGREGGSGKSGTDAIVAVTTVSRRTILFRHGRDDPGEQGALIAGSGIERPAREIETAGVPGVAAERGIPLREMRSIADTVAEPLPFTIEESLDQERRLRAGRHLHSFYKPSSLP